MNPYFCLYLQLFDLIGFMWKKLFGNLIFIFFYFFLGLFTGIFDAPRVEENVKICLLNGL